MLLLQLLLLSLWQSLSLAGWQTLLLRSDNGEGSGDDSSYSW